MQVFVTVFTFLFGWIPRLLGMGKSATPSAGKVPDGSFLPDDIPGFLALLETPASAVRTYTGTWTQEGNARKKLSLTLEIPPVELKRNEQKRFEAVVKWDAKDLKCGCFVSASRQTVRIDIHAA